MKKNFTHHLNTSLNSRLYSTSSVQDNLDLYSIAECKYQWGWSCQSQLDSFPLLYPVKKLSWYLENSNLSNLQNTWTKVSFYQDLCKPNSHTDCSNICGSKGNQNQLYRHFHTPKIPVASVLEAERGIHQSEVHLQLKYRRKFRIFPNLSYQNEVNLEMDNRIPCRSDQPVDTSRFLDTDL